MQHLNKKSVMLLIGFLLASSPILTQAADWSSIIKNADYEIFVDIDSYNMIDHHPSIVSKTIFKSLQNKTHNANKIRFKYTESLQQFNCRTPVYRTKTTKFYDQKNKLMTTENGSNEFKAITAGSNEFSIGQLVCQVHQMVGGQ